MQRQALRLLPASGYRRMPWKNGGGVTTEIARAPAGGDDFDWRVSIADIAEDGPFSAFPGIDRQLLLLDGGVELCVDATPPVRLELRHARIAFAGEATVQCRLLGGPSRDFNLMTRRGVFEGELLARPLVGPMAFFPTPRALWLIHAASGSVHPKDTPTACRAEAGDTLELRAEALIRPLVLSGHGEIVLVRLTRL